MARPLRILVAGGWYQVVNRGHRRSDLFLTDTDRRRSLVVRRFTEQRRFAWTSWLAATYVSSVVMHIEIEREQDGRWLAEIPDLPGVMAYGQAQAEAVAKVKALALRVMADRLEHGEAIPELVDVFSVPA